jgi:hypothetical protein
MTISNTSIVDTTSKYIVKSTGIKNEIDQVMVNGELLNSGTNETKASLIECIYSIEGTGTMTISTSSEDDDLELTGKGKYGLRPDQLKFGNDVKILLSTDSNVKKYLLITQFRRN